jgi:hypothetical protein
MSRLSIFVLPLIIVFTVLVSGCYSTKPGLKAGERVKEEKIVGNSFSIEEENGERGKVKLRVSSENEKKVVYEEKRQEMSKRSLTLGTYSISIGLAGVAGGLIAAPGCLTKEQVRCTSQSSRDKVRKVTPYILAGGALTLFGLGEWWWAASDSTYEYRGDYTFVGEEERIKQGNRVFLSNEKVVLKINGKRNVYKTNGDGAASIDIPEDFGITSTDELKPLIATALLPDQEYSQSITLDQEEWMIPYARLRRPEKMREQSLSDSRVLQSIKVGEELRISKVQGDWVRVRRSGQEGWLPASSINRFWSVPTRLDPNRPPRVAASVDFIEPSGNDRLDADETATVQVTARNEGKGPAYRVRAYVEPKSSPHLSYPQTIKFGRISAGQSETETIRVEADRELSSRDVSLTVRFQEANGFAPSAVKLQFETRKFIPPELTVADVGIDDASGNGVIEPGEVVDVTARIRNQSRGQAESVDAQVNFEGENVFAGPNTRSSFDLGDLGPGEHQDIQFSLLSSQQAESVPVTLDITEKYGEFGKTGIKLPLRFETPTDQITEVQVTGQETDMAVQTGGQLSVDVETNIPSTPMDRPDAIAVVVGIRSYSAGGVPNVEYARRDARYMREYLTQTLGFREENILPRSPDGRMTYAELRTLIQDKLPSYVKEGASEVFIYYSGHGAPSTGEDRSAYLVPSDTDPNFVSDANAYQLGQFYEDLAALQAESVTVALDACFTGQAGSGEMMLRQASPLALSVENPLLGIEDATGLLASGPKQVANWYPEKKHGMFTYFFLKGLKGEADLDDNRKVTVREMERYLTDENSGVPHWSGRVHQRTQMPQVVSQNPERVLVRFGNNR